MCIHVSVLMLGGRRERQNLNVVYFLNGSQSGGKEVEEKYGYQIKGRRVRKINENSGIAVLSDHYRSNFIWIEIVWINCVSAHQRGD